MVARTVEEFWEKLKKAYGDVGGENIFTKPELCLASGSIYKIQTKYNYIFDDAFWNIFHRFPFHICHINYGCYGNVYELRFKIEQGGGNDESN